MRIGRSTSWQGTRAVRAARTGVPAFAWLLIGGLAILPATARAQDAATQAHAAQLNREAAEHAKRGEWDVASAMLAEAYRLTRDASLLVNLAATELKAGRNVQALHHLQAYLADPNAEAKVKTAVSTQLLPRAMASTAHLTIHFPAGGRLTVDGELVSVEASDSVALVDVMPGDHVVEINASGASGRQSVTAAAGASLDVQAVPSAAPAPAPAATPAPVATPATTPPDSAEKPASASESFWTARHVVPLGLLVVGVAAAGTGIGFRAGANSAANQCTGGCANYNGQHSTYNTDSGVATGLFIGAGVFAAAAVVTWFVWPAPDSTSKTGGLQVRPFVGPLGGGVGGRF